MPLGIVDNAIDYFRPRSCWVAITSTRSCMAKLQDAAC